MSASIMLASIMPAFRCGATGAPVRAEILVGARASSLIVMVKPLPASVAQAPMSVPLLSLLRPEATAGLRLTVVVPTYNEADNLAALTQALLALPFPQLQLLIVDDNSPDGTGALADTLAQQANADAPTNRPRMVVIHRPGKGGLGTAYVAGMRRALDDGADYVVQMDADFSHSPAYITAMLGVMLATDAHVVIGSRYVPGGTLDEGWGPGRRFLSWWANLYSRAILGLRIRDMTAGFKLWRREALLGIGLECIRSNGYSFQVEMAYLCEKLGYHLIEIPIHFEDRRIGQSKLDIPVKLESAWRTWQIRWRYRALRGAGPGRPHP